jgi:3-methylcrotonyl-CoA carboxylase alpha subunit
MNQTYEYNGTPYTVRLEHNANGSITAHIGESVYTVHAQTLADGSTQLELEDGTRALIHTAQAGDERYAQYNGTAYTLQKLDARASRRRNAVPEGDLTAQMPGQVVDVLVQEGEAVSAGQALVILEAMKMEIRISAPIDGVVMRVMVAAGDVVERGAALVEVVAE